MIKFISVLGCFILISSFTLLGDNWEFMKEENGIKVYTAPKQGSNFKKCKVLTNIKTTLDKLYNYIRDPDNFKKYSEKISKVKLINKTDKSVVYYLSIDMPWPVYDRDGVYEMKTIEKTANKAVISIDARPKLIEEQKDFVRIVESNITYKITTNGEVQDIHYEKFTDPNGSIPAWLSNSYLVDSPIEQFNRIKKDLE